MGNGPKGRKLVECNRNPATKVLSALAVVFILIVIAAAAFTNFIRPGLLGENLPFGYELPQVCLFVFLPLALFLATVVYPDITVYEGGLVVKVLWRPVFVAWDDVVMVRETPRQTMFYVKRLTVFNYLVGIISLFNLPAFRLEHNRSYYAARPIFQEKLGYKFPS